ncbi:MAG: DNA (cytosine-5-)-methyltransferase [Opitutae bacterium]|nr:DNA (cytosine-5-)-methyltransferase [Opitutae bacterium]|tara:strand:- start:6826 stop:7962 length:1137 start_codon:yes stop_codon:yes gene_type:complete
MEAISLFSGAGGLDLGAHHAGARVRCCVEWDEDSVDTLKSNLKEHPCAVLKHDISQLSGDQLLSDSDVRKSEVAIMLAGPPCQSFSKNNYWTKNGDESLRRRQRAKRLADKKGEQYIGSTKSRSQVHRVDVDNDIRTSMVMEYARLIKEIQPESYVFENVSSILHPKNKRYLDAFISYTEEIGYSTTQFVASSEEYGVPQKRKRVFVLGMLGKTKPKTPEITHSDNEPLFLLPVVPVKDYIHQFRFKKYHEPEEIFTGRWADYIPEIPPGMNYKALTAWAGHKNPIFEAETRFWNFLLKLSPDKPSWTISANPGPWTGPFHWDNRRLRTTEMAAIQTFPAEYIFKGSRRSKVRQIGNAVPVLLGRAVVKSLVDSLNGR